MKATMATVATALVLLACQVGTAQQPGYDPAGGYVSTGLPGATLVRGQQAGPACATGQCDPCAACCPYKWQFFGDFLYMRARSAEITYAMGTDSLIDPLAVGRLGVVDADYEPAYRFGLARALDECSSIGVSYTHFESESLDELHVVDPQQIYPLVLAPSVLATAPLWRDVFARQDIDFHLIDVDYRYTFSADARHDLALLVGARYVNLKQASSIGFFSTTGDTIGDEDLFTHVNFDGAGVRLGLEGERRAANCGLLVYGKAAASFVAGEFRADLIEARGTANGAIPIVDTSWKAGRLVTMLDLELGAGWTSRDGRIRLTGGYMLSGWLNTIKNADWIHAVQNNDFRSLDNSTDHVLNFDGFVAHAELRF
jgi:hypothetical protein